MLYRVTLYDGLSHPSVHVIAKNPQRAEAAAIKHLQRDYTMRLRLHRIEVLDENPITAK